MTVRFSPPDCDFNTWRDVGMEGWSLPQVRPYFDRVDERVKENPPSPVNPILEAFVNGCHELRFPS